MTDLARETAAVHHDLNMGLVQADGSRRHLSCLSGLQMHDGSCVGQSLVQSETDQAYLKCPSVLMHLAATSLSRCSIWGSLMLHSTYQADTAEAVVAVLM